ncbi:hypothetical protein C823_003449 [Eubacterium plexicaudatum ASF492]|nr:hypothetical protein C823_003449 [Eubacterium plexicaudatum ASF492]
MVTICLHPEDIYDFAVVERETLRNYPDLRNGIPSHDTMQRVFAIIRPDELQAVHGDYCLAFKGNRKQAYEEIRNYFACKDLLENIRQKAVHNLGLIRRFVMFIIKLMKTYYGRSMRRVRKTIGKNPKQNAFILHWQLNRLYTLSHIRYNDCSK